jgi:CRISPR-associated protein Csx16
MTTFFISRHHGALAWIRKHDIAFDRHMPHLDMDDIHPGDVVIGSLPVNLAAEACARGAIYRHLSIKLEAADRGRELSVEEMDACEATLENYHVEKI